MAIFAKAPGAERHQLLHDGQYRDQEYGAHVGWGHSSIGDALEFANKADVDKLVLFHHDPYHTDGELEDLLVEAQGKWPGMESRVCLAYEGMTITLDVDGTLDREGAAGAERIR